ncbi:hypothetical protein [Cerasicoccus fimbriatus]|uniref:hypothetical protein n=1 Tax=Cerasicoccus fimbriatus TaxID=3014554 RepID=UPI0022B3A733|nr:hypothetical protein [Cerasicoccus sp. TK19100]
MMELILPVSVIGIATVLALFLRRVVGGVCPNCSKTKSISDKHCSECGYEFR